MKFIRSFTLGFLVFQDMAIEVDKDATGELQFPNFLQLMANKYSENNAEDEIREAFKVFDSVSNALHYIFYDI